MSDYTDAFNAGWHIFPLHPIVNGACSCAEDDCEAAGKHPKNKAWQHTPVWDDNQMAYLEDDEGIFGGNQLLDHYGVVVNLSGLLVVDWDGRNGGEASAEKLAHIRAQCGFVVRTGSGAGEHWYFKHDGQPLRQSLRDYPGIDFKSTGYVVGCGSIHASGMRYEAVSGGPDKIGKAPTELLELLARPVNNVLQLGKDITGDELETMVNAIPCTPDTDYHHWIEVGMAIHDATGGDAAGQELWAQWSRKGNPSESDEALDAKWHSFGKSANPVTAGTLVKLARDAGYIRPVEFIDTTEWEPLETSERTKISRIDYNSIAAEGSMVGEVTKWIDSRCMYPRPALAFAAALQAVGNLAGMRYRATDMDTTLNLITFAIADSATGKEAILQSISEIMREAGVGAAFYGKIKSEQEVVRNLVRHQPSFYVVDEYGTELAKIGRAKGGGGAAYLAAVPELIMSIYSKANEYYSLSGDMAEEIRENLEKQVSAATKRADSGDKKAEKDLERLKIELLACYDGLKNPFLSFIGFTEPRSFDSAIGGNLDLLVNGFIGRATIFREHDAMPRVRKNYKKPPLPEYLAGPLRSLVWGGSASIGHGEPIRIYTEPERIPLTDEASRELDIVSEYWYSEGLPLEQEGQGLQTITRRAWEAVIKIAAILSIPANGSAPVIDVEHVRAAQRVVRDITEYKISHCKTVLGAHSEDDTEKAAGLLSGVISIVQSYKDGVGAGVIRNRLRSAQHKPKHIDDAIAHLVANNKLEKIEYRDGRNRQQTKYKIY